MKRLTALFITIVFVLGISGISYAESFEIDAPAYILIEASTGQVLLEKNADQRMYPASTTKIMTAILALENGDMDQLMSVSTRAADPGPGGMNIGIMPGEELRLRDLLNAMLIKSANETANIIAENIGGTIENFSDMMNTRAAELGAKDTHFITPSGMHEDEHYTTARDMALFARHAMSLPEFREIVQKPYYDMAPTNKHNDEGVPWTRLYSSNRLLGHESPYYEKITGIKTGYTSKAGNCLVASAVNSDGVELISVVFGVQNNDGIEGKVYNLSNELLEYGFRSHALTTVSEAGKLLQTVVVADAEGDGKLPIVTGADFTAFLPVDQPDPGVEEKLVLNDPHIKAPVKQGDVLGYVEYEKDGVILGKVDALAGKTMAKKAPERSEDKISAVLSNLVFRVALTTVFCTIILLLIVRPVLRRISRSRKQRHHR